MKDTEIEIQVKVSNTKKLINFLKKNGKFIGEIKQIDFYYTPKHRSFVDVRPVKEWFRLRTTPNHSSITYKNWKYTRSGKSWHCDEYNTKIENPSQFKKILEVLNFKLLSKVSKNRKKWRCKNFEISIDKVSGLGEFVEVEYRGRKKLKVKDAVSSMVSFLKEQKCGRIQRNNGGYPYMLMFPKEVKFEDL
jgi:adenylate cyclase class 2